jgi:aryl-alcohol dehydrogenase-like predicted oxidoreductase
MLLGRVLQDRRAQVVIATKIPPKTFRWPVTAADSITSTFPRDWIIRCTEQSLKRLRTDHIDVQQLHAWADAYTQQQEWYEALRALQQQGKIRAFGVSANDWDPYGPVNAMTAGRLDSVQVIYNIFEQRPAEQMFPAALAKAVGIIVRVPFEEGLLTGAFPPDHLFAPDDWRVKWLTPERLQQAAPRVDKLRAFLNEDRPTLAALALKFCLSHPAVSTVIPGMRRVAHVEANCAVSDGVLLKESELNELAKHSYAHGWKYPWS